MKEKVAALLLLLALLGVSVDSKVFSFAFKVASEVVQDTAAMLPSPNP